MTAWLYVPNQPPQGVTTEGLSLPNGATRFARVLERVPLLLSCMPGFVDVLASGPEYVAYSVFDSEQEINHAAMTVVEELSGFGFDLKDDDTILRGNVLIVRV